MKKQFLFLTLMMLSIFGLQAQTIGEYYTFSESAFPYQNLTGATVVLDGDSDDGEATNIPIGFDFHYAGTKYSTLTIGVNGAVSFTSANIDYINNLAGTDADNINMIAPLWDDLDKKTADGGIISYKTIGAAPERVFMVEWKNISWRNAGEFVTFSLYLEEDGTINFLYGPNGSSETRTASIGINAGNSGTNFISVTPGSPATASSVTANNVITSNQYPGNNKVYSFNYGPENNACANATNLTVASPVSAHTTGTIFAADDFNNNNYNEVWYKATVPASGSLNFETFQAASSAFDDTYVVAYAGTCASLTSIGGDDDGGDAGFSKLTLTGRTPGETVYFIIEEGDPTTPDEFEVLAYQAAPANDACADAVLVTPSDFLVDDFLVEDFNAIGATNNGGFLMHGDGQGMNDGVWYKIVGDGADYNLTVTPNAWDAELGLFSGTCGSLTAVDYSDSGIEGESESLSFTSVIGTTYYINIGYYSKSQDEPEGVFSFQIEKSCAPTNVTSWPAENIESCPGENVTLSVAATGVNLKYQWSKNMAIIPGETNPTLNLTNLQPEGLVNYDIVVTNACATETTPGVASGLVTYPNTIITLQPQDINANVGEDVSFTVAVNGGDLTYMWYKEGASIAGATNPTYSINNVQSADAGQYLVTITGHCGNVSSNNATLDVSTFVNTLDASNFTVYPNPANDFLNIKTDLNIENVSVYDISGKQVNVSANNSNNSINISNLTSGIYFVKISNNEGSFLTKFVKK